MQLNPTLLRLYKTPLFLALAIFVLYVFFAYDLERTEYLKLISFYTALFAIFYWLVKNYANNTKLLTGLAFLFRAVFVLAIPNLSQDFYRFIWDGNMILEGFNPYLYTVDSFITKGEFPVDNAQELYVGMGKLNASHFTNYPPINQLCFVLANLLPAQSILSSVVGLRLIIITADFGTLYFGKKLLQSLNLPVHNIFWYVLNPFIIIELTGNLHFEGVMIFFLIWSMYLLHKGKWQWSAVVLALSISTKLIPLMFLPLVYQLFVKRPFDCAQGDTRITNTEVHNDEMLKQVQHDNIWVRMTRLIGYYAIVGGVTLSLFASFFSVQFISNYAETVGLWFQNFEFNASVYYLLREIGYTIRGYNEIAILGVALSLIVFLFTLYRTFFKRNATMADLIKSMLLVFACYLFLSTTVHPWYIATLLALSVFTKYKFPLVWSFIIILSYLAYMQIGNASKTENLFIIALEYLVVYGVFFWEIFKGKIKPA